MTTGQLFLARATTGRHWYTALDRWVKFSDSTRTKEGLRTDIFARWTESNVAEVSALVEATSQLLVALDHAEMATLGIASVAHWAAHLFTVVLLTLLQLVAHSFAFQVVDAIDLFSSHQFASKVVRIVDLEAGELGLSLVAHAAFVDQLLTLHAVVIVALLDALVLTAG